jgi:tetratricopeptide (TPR) repeat protein
VTTRSDALEEAQRGFTRGDLYASLRYSLEHLSKRPWSKDASLIAARCLSRLDFADEAEPHYRRAGKLSLDDLHIRAYGLVRANHREQAIKAYTEILADYPDNILAMSRLAAVQITQSNTAEALKLADKLIAIPRGAAMGYTLKGALEHDEKNPESAVLAFEQVLKLDPDLKSMPLPKTLFWSHLTNDLLSLGRTEEVRNYLTRVLSTTQDYGLTMILASAHELAGDIDSAEVSYRQALTLNPQATTPSLQLGKIALRRQQPEAAIEHLLRVKAQSPRNYDTLYNLSMAYRRLGKVAEADRYLKLAEQIRAAQPANPVRPKTPLPAYSL